MANEAADYLLEKHGIISLPDTIDHAGYEMVLHRLTQGRTLHPDKPLRLFCHGSGGLTYDTLAIVDLIRADGRVDGMLSGVARSSASVIWASCTRRFVYPLGRIGVHPVQQDHAAGTAEDFLMETMELQALDWDMCVIYAAASNKLAEWWKLKLYEPGDFKWLLANELIAIEMGKPVSERAS